MYTSGIFLNQHGNLYTIFCSNFYIQQCAYFNFIVSQRQLNFRG
jgi:hypothetical protein